MPILLDFLISAHDIKNPVFVEARSAVMATCSFTKFVDTLFLQLMISMASHVSVEMG